jgi:stage II sporulation protein P
VIEEENLTINTTAPVFVPRQKVDTLDMSTLAEYETLVKTFYTIDSSTMIGSDQLNTNLLNSKNMSITKDPEAPQILIFHTHYNEAFADSTPGDSSTGIVGVGENLTKILEEDYGYNVIHYTGEYDMQAGPDAYSGALPIIEQILADNPSIQVVLDLHRDAAGEGDRLVMDLDGRPTAQFMFFNGLSRTRKTGNIAYLYNENLDSNLAFSFQLQTKALEYYPGLTRKIYLKAYRYNMHLSPRYALVEMGAQNNTLQEVMNACYPLAHILDLVLSGEP